MAERASGAAAAGAPFHQVGGLRDGHQSHRRAHAAGTGREGGVIRRRRFSHLSASIVLSRKRASEGLFPAIDPLQSSSKMATPGIVGQRHYALAQEIRRTLAQYADLKDIIAMLGLEQLSSEDRKVVARARRLERFLTQSFFTTEQFTGLKGKLVSLKDTLDGCERILRDEFKDYPESALYMIGTIAEAKGRANPEAPKSAAKPKPEVAHAAGTHES